MKKEAEIKRRYAIMREDFITESMNLGWRQFEKGKRYKVDHHQEKEFVDAGVADIVEEIYLPMEPPIRRDERIVSKVTRWFTSNGLDTRHLAAGKVSAVPSNLAVYLILNDFAEAA